MNTRRGVPRRLTPPILALVLPLFIGGCAALFRSPTVEIVDVRLVGLGLSSGTAEVTLEVDNPNLFRLEVREFSYLLEIEGSNDRWTRLAEGSSLERVELPRRSTEEVRLRVPFEYGGLGTALQSWWNTGQVNYRIAGDIRARGPGGERDLPFRARGQMAP
jgi:LEA14-like dessication related protein